VSEGARKDCKILLLKIQLYLFDIGRDMSRVENNVLWFLKQPHSEAKGKDTYNVWFWGGSPSTLAVLATILISGHEEQIKKNICNFLSLLFYLYIKNMLVGQIDLCYTIMWYASFVIMWHFMSFASNELEIWQKSFHSILVYHSNHIHWSDYG
jgi:hypothetical protein